MIAAGASLPADERGARSLLHTQQELTMASLIVTTRDGATRPLPADAGLSVMEVIRDNGITNQ